MLDSNVLAAANDLADHAGPDCAAAAARELIAVRDDLLLLDDRQLILTEYKRTRRPRNRQPGPADFFLRWLFQVVFDEEQCRLVTLTPVGGAFVEYPPDAELSAFDVDDRVYVAVAIASGSEPEIVNATDSDWDGVTDHLRSRYGITVRRLCS